MEDMRQRRNSQKYREKIHSKEEGIPRRREWAAALLRSGVKLYSIGTVSSLLGQNMMEESVKKRMYICIFVGLGHYAAQQKVVQHCKSTILYTVVYTVQCKVYIILI